MDLRAHGHVHGPVVEPPPDLRQHFDELRPPAALFQARPAMEQGPVDKPVVAVQCEVLLIDTKPVVLIARPAADRRYRSSPSMGDSYEPDTAADDANTMPRASNDRRR